MQELSWLAGQWVQRYIQAGTGSVAHGVEAAGIQVALPGEVGSVLAMLTELGRYEQFPDGILSTSMPFVLDTWLSVLG